MTKRVSAFPELVAGVRNISTLNACKNHVDAVYFSLDRFSLRARAQEISSEYLSDFVHAVHHAGLKAYLTVNSVIYPEDIKELDTIMDHASSAEIDAVICWDPATIEQALDNGLKVHISTQANVSNHRSAEFYHSLGAERVVLSRELSLEQIADIRNKTDMELEVFVHGAMCHSISGRCYLSAYLAGGSANCGECTQPCRWEWTLVADDGSMVEVGGKYLLSAKDLCMIEHIQELVDTGIDAFKIEGRLRDTRYISHVSSCYANALSSVKDGNFSIDNVSALKKDIESVFNRGLSTGFYFGTPSSKEIMLNKPMNASSTKKQPVGIVTNYYSKKKAASVILKHSSLCAEDRIVIEGNTTFLEQNVESIIKDNTPIKHAYKGDEVGLEVVSKVRKNDRIFKLINSKDTCK
ncbi:peptidase U32 [Methanosalsum zhilinae DSM 4017]|uniref:Peptidase U32 n=1 Tax=Methanosalsum zhilinae (strain DSM 4017 / NBRC 107636 / OCM 62 / WeN5) TaxID=679901 RepID=F7XKB1_METZD|nr:peptidase U32 family protein [Methanosalsum zhilinae]AEH60580.1 peptidase U32 [Methanosalsum zhilinae DSM 4017]